MRTLPAAIFSERALRARLRWNAENPAVTASVFRIEHGGPQAFGRSFRP
jgi:hypothetical protein